MENRFDDVLDNSLISGSQWKSSIQIKFLNINGSCTNYVWFEYFGYIWNIYIYQCMYEYMHVCIYVCMFVFM